MRAVIAIIEVDDSLAIESNMGTLDYLDNEFRELRDSGIFLNKARILDDDDPEDEEAIDLACKIFDI